MTKFQRCFEGSIKRSGAKAVHSMREIFNLNESTWICHFESKIREPFEQGDLEPDLSVKYVILTILLFHGIITAAAS